MAAAAGPASKESSLTGPLKPIQAVLLFFVFLGVSLLLFAPVMNTGWLSDDWSVIAQNPYLQPIDWQNLQEMFSPYGPAVVYALNYSPIHLLLHAIELQLFGENFWALHFVNLLLHAGTALLLVALLIQARIPKLVAAAAGFFFLVHPANVEAVAFIFQAKTTLSTALALGALLLVGRRPVVATVLFALAMATKASALFLLPVLAVLWWSRSGGTDEGGGADEGRPAPHPAWIAVWALVALAVSLPEFDAFDRVGHHTQGLGEDAWGRMRSIVAIAMRYLVMAATGYGVSPLHQTEAADSWSDPWWLAGVVALLALGWRTLSTLRRRDEEAIYWVMAVAAFAPICQIFPFIYPMADRYLYTILPGLLGGVLLAARSLSGPGRLLRSRLGGRLSEADPVVVVASAGLLMLSLALAAYTTQRVPVYSSELRMIEDSVPKYPDGLVAWHQRLEHASRNNDPQAAALALEAMYERDFVLYKQLLGNPNLARVLADPAPRKVIERMAAGWIERFGGIEQPHQIELFELSQALLVQGRLVEAVTVMERALEVDGRLDDRIRPALADTKRAIRIQEHQRSRLGRPPD